MAQYSARAVAALALALLVVTAIAPRAAVADEWSGDGAAPVGLFPTIERGYRGLIHRDNGILLGVGAASAALALQHEDPRRAAAAIDASPLGGGVDFGDAYGHGATVGGVAAGLIVLGSFGHEGMAAAGRDLMASFVVTGSTTWIMKAGIGRERPLGGPHSFPSGHTAMAFSTIPVAYQHGGRWLGLTATVLAIGTGAARMEDQRHYASDVLFGAALGLAAGNAVVGHSIPWAGIWNKLKFSGDGVGVDLRF